MINCDTDNDEYFENHYQFCHGILNTPLSTDTDYEHRRVLLIVDGEYYARCKSRTPLSLRILSCNEILKHKEITMVGASFLPRELMTLLKEVGLNIQKKDDWDVIKSSMSVLLEYWPYKVLHLEARSHKRWFQLALTHLVLDRFAAEIDSDALQKPCRNQLTEFVMKDSVQSGESGCYRNLQRKLFSTVCSDQRRWVFDHIGPTRKCIITTNLYIRTEIDLRRVLYMLRLSRKPGSRFEIRIINWHIHVVYNSVLAKISQEVNPEIVKSFSMTIQPEDILKLDEILKPCVALTSLSLTLSTAERYDGLGQRLANDLTLLIGHHPTLKRLVLNNFENRLDGHWDICHLPISLETLVLKDSLLTCVDLEHWTDSSTISHIQDLTISNFFLSIWPSEIEGYLKFVESQAETLVSLHINLSRCEYQPTVDRLKRMAERLAKFNKLQRFTYHEKNVDDILVILRDVLPLIESLKSYDLRSDSCLFRHDRDFLQSLQLAMKKICIGRKGLLDFATVIFYVCREFQDGIFIGEYDDLLEVMGYQCHSPDDYDCEHDIDEDFQDGIPIGEYERLCEVLGYQCQLPDDYDCEHVMEDLPISEYEEVCEVVGNQCHLPDDYDCEHDMDDSSISVYEAAFILANMNTYCEVVGYQCHLPADDDCDMDVDVVCDQ